ncbi:hypothetical protein DPMN_091822 [Dreissena polymorpha]|uniref:Uncharacterized protein n=1 Tax=Dreissena polymorpha TaxID=45954 RepID=A0A9D4R0C0_DREPO|nr:hypothetical protein DPMN_091822 [Dreissena polymorpha]
MTSSSVGREQDYTCADGMAGSIPGPDTKLVNKAKNSLPVTLPPPGNSHVITATSTSTVSQSSWISKKMADFKKLLQSAPIPHRALDRGFKREQHLVLEHQ